MAKKKLKTKPSVRDNYPNHPRDHGGKAIRSRSSATNRVRWETFATIPEAEKCAEWAKVEAQIKYEMGYDAGYCSPGSIAKTEHGFEVCIL